MKNVEWTERQIKNWTKKSIVANTLTGGVYGTWAFLKINQLTKNDGYPERNEKFINAMAILNLLTCGAVWDITMYACKDKGDKK